MNTRARSAPEWGGTWFGAGGALTHTAAAMTPNDPSIPKVDAPARSSRSGTPPDSSPCTALVPQIEPLLAGLLNILQGESLRLLVIEASEQPLPFRRVLRVDVATSGATRCRLHAQTDREVADLLECTTLRIHNTEDAICVQSSLQAPLGSVGEMAGVIELLRRPPMPSYARSDLDQLQTLLPGIALALHSLLRCRWSQLYAATVENLPHGIALIDGRRNLQGCNASMQRALERGDGLRLLDGQVIASHAKIDSMVSNAVRRVLVDPQRRERVLVEIERPGQPLPYLLLLRADVAPPGFAVDDRSLIRMTLADPAGLHYDALREITSAAGLTAAERDVALAMVQGYDTAETAARMNIAQNTVRWHQKRIFGKTGTRGRTDLALRLMLAITLYGP